jgi:hypothetical protein
MRFTRAVQALVDGEVEFVVIGGVSAELHGSATVTFDIDICYSRTGTNLKRLVAALAPFRPRPRGFPDDLPYVWNPATLRNSTVLTLKTDLGDIDLLAEVAGVGTWDEVKAQSLEIEAFERRLRILDLPALIKSKRAAGRPKDLAVLHELESLLEATQE